MKQLIIFLGFFTFLITSCNDNESDGSLLITDFLRSEPTCPLMHQDSIIPIEYGMPTEELFAEADSGKVYLGGCELMDDNWWCKIHNITFE
jgi:hypothetical protein